MSNRRTPSPVVAARVYRGETAEATHYADIAVVDQEGRLIRSLGNPGAITMTRSSIKPFQLCPLIMTGAADAFGFDDEQLSIMAGSHSGTDRHREVVLRNLTQIGLGPEYLQCGAHLPLGMQTDGRYPSHDEDKDPLRHNCSGKHSGFLALAKQMGVDPARYLDPDTPHQQLIRQAVAEVCEYDVALMPPAIDGCSAPNFPLPLVNLARGFMRLAYPQCCRQELASALTRVRRAMTAFPVLYSGEGRFDFNLMSSLAGRVVCKGGAEALQGIGLVEPRLGIAVKVQDGGARALGAICIESLSQLGAVDDLTQLPLLSGYVRPEVRNNRRLLTGHIVTEFKLERNSP